MVAVQPQNSVYATIENRPGTLERASRILADKRINIDAISVETVGFMGAIRILTQKSKEAQEALRAHGIEAHDSEHLIVTAQNKPGELTRICSELAAAGVNVESVLTTPEGKLAMRTSDNELASRILGKL